MIAIAKEKTKDTVPVWHKDFLALLPAIRRHASIAFRILNPEAREEAIQETVCNAMVAYRRLVELGKTNIAYPSVLARYGVAQTRSGRKVGGKLNGCDCMSRYARQKQGFQVERLDRFDQEEQGWQEIVVEDRHAGPDVVAATRIDFGDWLKTLTNRQRKIADLLAIGETTKTAAERFGLTAGRVSQVRRELKQAWEVFVGDSGCGRRAPATV
jgi:hypothetical protein